MTCLSAVVSATAFAGGNVSEFTLSNGLKVLYSEVKDNPLVTAQLFLQGGSINEKPAEAGLASFTQSLLFQGTKTRAAEQLAQEVEDIGGNLSSDSEHDYSSLGISLMDTNFDKAMEILADVAFNPSFPEDEIEKERENTLAGILSRKDQIFSAASDLFGKTFYGDHPYSWPDSGKAETVAKFKRADLVRWHSDHYSANNMLLVIAGNVPQDAARAAAEKYFSKAPAGKASPSFPAAKAPGRKEVSEKSKKFRQAFYMIGYPAPNLKDRDFASLKVLNALLGGRMSGRLFIELREKLSLAYEVSSFYPSRRELSRFVVYLGLEARNLPVARERIQEILAEIKENGVPQQELDETKRYIRGVYLLDHQTIGRQAWYLGFWETVGRGYTYDARYLDELNAVTTEDIQRVARKYFTDQNVQIEIVPQ